MSAWRQAGISYLQQLNYATTALRKVVKENVAKKYANREMIYWSLTDFSQNKTTTVLYNESNIKSQE